MPNVLDQMRAMSLAPSRKESFDLWLQGADALEFLRTDICQDEIVIYAGVDHVFIHGILVPAALLKPLDIDDLMAWNFNAYSSWGVSYAIGDPSSICLEPPLHDAGSKTLAQGEKLVFARSFEGRPDQKHEFEILQKFVHISNLYFMYERNAFCRLDEMGDIEEVIRVLTLTKKKDGLTGTIITFGRSVLDEYMALTGTALVRTFDFTRFRSGEFGGWSGTPESSFKFDGDLFYRWAVEHGNASYFRGCQVLSQRMTKEEVYARYNRRWDKDREYASFIAYDWRHGVVKEISCAPGATANYFVKSDLPFEVSPAFFRPEVLLKYKADPEKYHLDERSITCRGTWHLKTYDINEAGQVHTYLAYLRDLPYGEQLYWNNFNEAPKALLSKRAITTDFKGEWDLEYDPLESVKAVIRELVRKEVAWWSLRSERLIDQAHYPVTSSDAEWATELLNLDQLVVEGFEEKWLRQKALALGRKPDQRFRSLKLIEECLTAFGFEGDHARTVTAPLYRLHELRSKLKGHASGEEAVKIKREVLLQHKSYKDHFRALCAECDEALHIILDAFEKAGKNSSANHRN
jgi:hypothetical protein